MIYINGIATEIKTYSDINLFADDEKISGKLNDSLQLSLNGIYQWLKTRILKLKYIKCQILYIHKSKPTDFLINNTKLHTQLQYLSTY